MFVNEERGVNIRGRSSSVARLSKEGKQEVRLKAKADRERKLERWVDVLHKGLCTELDQSFALKVKINLITFQVIPPSTSYTKKQ